MKRVLIDSKPYDEFYTPSYAITPLLEYIPKDKELTIWEPTDFGGSNITKVLEANGFSVVHTSKEEIDFLKDEPNFEFDMIVTNPPYSLKDEFLEKCYELGKPFCLLLPITSLEGIKRGKMFRENGIEVLVFDKRCNFMNTKGNWFNTSWFCWHVLPEKLVFKELNRDGD